MIGKNCPKILLEKIRTELKVQLEKTRTDFSGPVADVCFLPTTTVVYRIQIKKIYTNHSRFRTLCTM